MSRVIKFRAWRQGKYEIGSDGSVWSTDFNHTGKRKQLKTYKDRDGYPTVFFNINGVRRIWAVHRLVAWAFLGEKPTPKHQVNHKSGVRDDNAASNLNYLTSRENTLDGWARGRKHSRNQLLAISKAMTAANMRRWHPQEYAKAA